MSAAELEYIFRTMTIGQIAGERLVRPLFYNSLTQEDQDQVIAAVRQFQP